MFKVNDSIGFMLAYQAKKTSSRFMQLMKENGIEFGRSGWIVLSRLWEEDGLNQQEISERSNVAKPNISGYCCQLEHDNYLVRTPDPKDKRNYLVFLTQKGKDAKELSYKLAEQASDETLHHLNEADKAELKRILGLMYKSCKG